MKMEKIAILDRFNAFGENLADRIRKAYPDVQVMAATDIGQIVAWSDDIDVLFTWPFIDAAVEQYCMNAPSLKWVQAFTAGVEGIVQSAIGKLDITITATKGIHGPPISDHVIAFIFSFLRSLPALREYQRSRVWYRGHEHPEEPDLASEESFDKTVGVIGLGSIGMCIAQKCKQLGMQVIGTKRTPVSSEWVDVCYPPEQIGQLLQTSDFVVIAAPLTRETAGLIGEAQLRQMKRSAYLINISRGAVVDEAALVSALQEKRIAGAALDTVAHEPLDPQSSLWEMPNVIITPHISANSHYSRDVRSFEAMMANLACYAEDRPLRHIVNKELGY